MESIGVSIAFHYFGLWVRDMYLSEGGKGRVCAVSARVRGAIAGSLYRQFDAGPPSVLLLLDVLNRRPREAGICDSYIQMYVRCSVSPPVVIGHSQGAVSFSPSPSKEGRQ